MKLFVTLLILYSKLIGASAIGMFIMILFKNKSFNEQSSASNLQYNGLSELLKAEKGRIIGTLLTISLLFLLVGKAVNPDNIDRADEAIKFLDGWVVVSRRIIYEGILVALFGTVGYIGVDIALRFFSATKKKMLAAIDYKTTKSDLADGVDPKSPTPK
jgi:hypothetical protein